MGYKQPFKKVGKVEPGMKNQSKSGVYQIGAIKSKSIKELEKSGKLATSNLQQAAFPDGGKGLGITPKKAKPINLSGGMGAFDYEFDKGAQRMYGVSGEDIKWDHDKSLANQLNPKGMGRVKGEGNILEQKEKFEKQFGYGSSKHFGFANVDPTMQQLQGKKGRAYDKVFTDQKKLATDMYDTAVEVANLYKSGKGIGDTIKQRGIVTDLGYQTSTPTPKPKKTKKYSRPVRRKQNVLENVGDAIQSLNPFKPRFGPKSKAGRKSTGRRWMKT